MKIDTKCKTAIIIGGTSGIGLATAKIFLDNNINCVIVGRSRKKGQAALEKLNSEYVHYISSDISKVENCNKIVNETVKIFNQIDILINCAGQYIEGAITDVEESAFDEIFNINVKGTFFMCRAVIPELIKTHGNIVNIASDAGLRGNYFCSVYSASKGAVVSFTRSLALELANIPIRVNCVAPGDVLTPMTQAQIKKSGESIESLSSVYPLQRIATPEEVAEAVYFLASEKSSFITGTILSVDGGLTC